MNVVYLVCLSFWVFILVFLENIIEVLDMVKNFVIIVFELLVRKIESLRLV